MPRIFIAGHKGMVGSAIHRLLARKKNLNIITAERKEVNLLSFVETEGFIKKNKIDQVYLCAAKVGGINANNVYPADFILNNLLIQNNLISLSHKYKVKRLLFLGSSCIYPKKAPQPIKENALLDGHLEQTNEPYAIAKISGIKLCESFNRQYGTDFRSIMPTNLYGPNDNFELLNSHVLPALIRKFDDAKKNKKPHVLIWGTGTPKREFLHVDDLAKACVHVMGLSKKTYTDNTQQMLSHINAGTGTDISIKNLAKLIKKITKYDGDIIFDKSKPDGTKRKLLDVKLINKLGWKSNINLEDGIRSTYDWYLDNLDTLRK